jgi:hypothetical protein
VGSQLRGARGNKRGHALKFKGTSDQASSSSSYPSKRGRKKGGIASNSSVTLQEHCKGTTLEFRRLLAHMVSKRFARTEYYPTRSSPGFRLATAYNLSPQSSASSTGLGQSFRFTSRDQIPSGQRGDSSYRQPRSRLLQPHFLWFKEAEGILEADNRPLPVKPVPTGSHFRMETTRSVTAAMLPGDWAVSLDL